ncbi:MAG TPA: helix-turn-helix transcriptional regulator [Blastocatellia bacterium]
MGTGARERPQHLAEKLLQIRLGLGLSQPQVVKLLGLEGVITYTKISHYELGRREPSLPTLLKYARAAGVSTDVLIDDEMPLPEKLPRKSLHKGMTVTRKRSR